MRLRRQQLLILSTALAALMALALLTQLDPLLVAGQGKGGMWPVTTDGRSRFAGWSRDGRTVLVNRWGKVLGNGTTRQALSELWAVGVQGRSASQLSETGLYPTYDAGQEHLAYLSFAGDGRWEARVLNLASGQERSWGLADWRTPTIWMGKALAFTREGKVSLHSGQPGATSFELLTLPAGVRVRFSPDGAHIAWSDDQHLWAARTDDTGYETPRLLVAEAEILDFVWAPDGHRLAYIAISTGSLSPELWVTHVGRDSSAPMFLVWGQEELFSAPSWSPDGRTLAFSRTPLGSATDSASDIWLASADGGHLRPLLHNDLEESGPAWSPDGRTLAFNREGDVWVVDINCDSDCDSCSELYC